MMQNKTDTVRTSRDGHEFHEAWIAHFALRLLFERQQDLSEEKLFAIAVEGQSSEQQGNFSKEVSEICDFVLYYGDGATFEDASKIEVIQVKYSVARAGKEFRMSDAKKTINKFSKAYKDYVRKYGIDLVNEKLNFEILTNRPIFQDFNDAIKGITKGELLKGNAKRQSEQFKSAVSMLGKSKISCFAGKCKITGSLENLNQIQNTTSNKLVNWSASNDAMANVYIGNINKMVRDKAGTGGVKNNLITKEDVLAALRLASIKDFLPCPEKPPSIKKTIKRQQFQEAKEHILDASQLLLIHAEGGVGKTVFLQDLAEDLKDKNEVIFFDCFAGGQYRSHACPRHRLQYGLVHIANVLAIKGFCDPIIPSMLDNNDEPQILKKFMDRVKQALQALEERHPNKKLILFLDAIDNAAIRAKETGTSSFCDQLIEELELDDEGLSNFKVIFSSRSHRKPNIQNECKQIELTNFTKEETKCYLSHVSGTIDKINLEVLHSKSKGNPRVLKHLISLDDNDSELSKFGDKIKIESLIEERIKRAIRDARIQGYSESAFLTGLAVLPLPVTTIELANSLRVQESEVKSFISDMSPLLEIIGAGIMLCDEPTETYIIENYANSKSHLDNLAKNLQQNQSKSTYAAAALPGLLYSMGDDKRLFELAFSEEFPEAITSAIGKNNIRYARLKTSIKQAAGKKNYQQLMPLLTEISGVVSSNERGNQYISDAVDMVVASNDTDAMRRLFEMKIGWEGSRHSRLAIAYSLSGNMGEAFDQADRTHQLLYNHFRAEKNNEYQKEKYPTWFDAAAIIFPWLVANQYEKIVNFANRLNMEESYDLHAHIFELIKQAEASSAKLTINVEEYIKCFPNDIYCFISALCIMNFDEDKKKSLVCKLSKACQKYHPLQANGSNHKKIEGHTIVFNLYKILGMAITLDLHKEAKIILKLIPLKRPKLHDFSYDYMTFSMQNDVLHFILHVALESSCNKRHVKNKDLLPDELFSISGGLNSKLQENEFIGKMHDKINKHSQNNLQNKETKKKCLSYEEQEQSIKFINESFPFFLKLANAMSNILNSSGGKINKCFSVLIDIFQEESSYTYEYEKSKCRFAYQLAFQVISYTLFIRSENQPNLYECAVGYFKKQDEFLNIQNRIDLVKILVLHSNFHNLAGKEAKDSIALLEEENDINQKASMYLSLARSMMNVSKEEGIEYFHRGLKWLDSVGPNEYEYTSELLWFASSLDCDELNEKHIHIFMSLYEMSLQGYEPEKFHWGGFGKTFAQIAGCRGLGKLIRWDANDFISLEYTLVMYIGFLVQKRKMDAKIAVALKNIVDYAGDYHDFGITDWAEIVLKKCNNKEEQKALSEELIKQWKESDGREFPRYIADKFITVLEKYLGEKSEAIKNAKLYHSKQSKCSKKLSGYKNSNHTLSSENRKIINKEKVSNKDKALAISRNTNALDKGALEKSINDFFEIEGNVYDLRDLFFLEMTKDLPLDSVPTYIENLAQIYKLNIHSKINELKRCKEYWGNSLLTLPKLYKKIARSIIRSNVMDFFNHDRLSSHTLDEVSDICDVPIHLLVIELINFLSRHELDIPGAAWLGLATLVSKKCPGEDGRNALIRLLDSDIVKMSYKIPEGDWEEGMYPDSSDSKICARIIWYMLGSRDAVKRWRAAHSLRCFARFGMWHVIDEVFYMMDDTGIQDLEKMGMKFYYLNARLWLLITLERMAIDYPNEISRYKDKLISIALSEQCSHVLMKHFASQAILKCFKNQAIQLSQNEEEKIYKINQTPLDYLEPTSEMKWDASDYSNTRNKFSSDPSFSRLADSIGRVFHKKRFEIEKLMSDTIESIDGSLESIYDKGGWEIFRGNNMFSDIDSRSHGYGHYLAWHASFIVAGSLLKTCSVNASCFDDVPDDDWITWLKYRLLSREDGLWLSDAMDECPIFVYKNLLEYGVKETKLTYDKTKILDLAGLKNGFNRSVIVKGQWQSEDGVHVEISSVLVKPENADSIIRRIRKDSIYDILPCYDDEYQESFYSHEEKWIPWIIVPYKDPGLDQYDPTSSVYAEKRPRISGYFSSQLDLSPDPIDDPIIRNWRGKRKNIKTSSYAWGQDGRYANTPDKCVLSLKCSKALIQELLSIEDCDLIIRIELKKTKEKIMSEERESAHSVSIVHINKLMKVKYHKILANFIKHDY